MLYFPVDASQSMLELASAGAEDEDIETVGIKADISSPMHLVYAADAAEPPRLFVFSGNPMGSFDPLAEIRSVAQCLKPADRLLVDGEIFDPELTLARRDNAAVRRFISALLAGVGIQESDGEIRFNLKNDSRHDGLHLVTRHFRAGRDLSATVASQEISLQRGERIGLNFQYAYTAASIPLAPDRTRWPRNRAGVSVLGRPVPDGVVPKIAIFPGGAELLKQRFERHYNRGAFGAQFLDFQHPLRRAAIRLAILGIQDPDVRDAEGNVVANPLLHSRHAVFRRKNLNTDERRRSKDLFRRLRSRDHADVRHAKSSGRHLHAHFRVDMYTPFLTAGVQIGKNSALQSRVIEISQVPLLDDAIHVVAIGAECRGQVLLNADKRSGRHRIPFCPLARAMVLVLNIANAVNARAGVGQTIVSRGLSGPRQASLSTDDKKRSSVPPVSRASGGQSFTGND